MQHQKAGDMMENSENAHYTFINRHFKEQSKKKDIEVV